nr:pentapeptide repeat-containing protein [Bradyrhizobium diazoefficiens]
MPCPAIARGRRRVEQHELDVAIALHGLWLEDRSRGRRADFGRCDLSGLDFGLSARRQVVLRNADFTEADLTGITGNDVNFHQASLQYASLAFSRLKAPVFSNAVLSGAKCNSAVWGLPRFANAAAEGQTEPLEQAVFMNTSMVETVFDHARIRGYFYDCSFAAASLVSTDLQQSQFCGPNYANRFGASKLIGTSFRYTQISSAVFGRAVISRADFLGASLTPQIAHHLRTRDAINLTDACGLFT